MSNQQKYLMGAAGVSGAAIVAWRTLFPWLLYDVKTISITRRVGALITRDMARNRTIIDMFEEAVSRRRHHPFLLFEERIYTYNFVNEMANRVANLALTWTLKVNDVVAIMIQNEPAFIWIFLGLIKIGLTVAFVNHHLRSKPLAHSINSSDPNVLIIGQEYLEAVEEVKDQISISCMYVLGSQQFDLTEGYLSMDESLERSLPAEISKSLRSELTLLSTLCYIYTSGTTGLPKPVIVNHAKAIAASRCFQWFNFTENDVVYAVTPFYHSAAICQSLFNTINAGATFVFGRKFSVRHFWEDCRKYKVTVIQYIGEMCRYLLRAPENSLDGVHNIRVAYGNGLRPDIWKMFQSRFKIPKIMELFGATEAPAIFMNACDKVAAVGRLSPLVSYFGSVWGVNTYIVKYDPIKDRPIRDNNGKCIKIKPGEDGLLITGISSNHSGFYKGIKEMDEKKLIRNAFEDGDAYFSWGDLIYLDKDYFMYFRDRVGDTFRWKSENVSTTEVSDVLNSLNFILDANVYGVEIPGSDGRAGMAAITLKENQERTSDVLQKIYEHCNHTLPSYARPIFLRFVPEVITTQTFKHRKIELVKEGFDPSRISDPIFYRDDIQKKYVPINQAEYHRVLKSNL